MRSYYDILKNYMEEKSLNGLHQKWYNCLIQKNIFNPNRFQFLQAYPSFNQMNHFYILQDLLSKAEQVDYYRPHKNGRLSKVYETFIREIEKKEEELLADKVGNKVEEWCHFKSHRRKSTKKMTSKLEAIWEEWVKIQGIKDQDVINHFSDRQQQASGRKNIAAINSFYNPWAWVNGIPTYQHNEQEIQNIAEKAIDIKVDFHSRSEYSNPVEAWSKPSSENSVQFFQSEESELFSEMNQKAHAGTTSVTANLKDLFTLPVEPSDWFDETYYCDLLNHDSESEAADVLSFDEKEKFSNSLGHRMQELYLIKGFEVTIESLANYSQKEVELLKNGNYRLFPFYFDDNLDFERNLQVGGDGSLKFTLKSTSEVPIIIGSGVKKLCNR